MLFVQAPAINRWVPVSLVSQLNLIEILALSPVSSLFSALMRARRDLVVLVHRQQKGEKAHGLGYLTDEDTEINRIFNKVFCWLSIGRIFPLEKSNHTTLPSVGNI